MLYFLSLLHQTTTLQHAQINLRSCISFLFYIKPQLVNNYILNEMSCISFLFYIKPQLKIIAINLILVVFPFSSTSNHNPGPEPLIKAHVVFPFSSTSNHNLLRFTSLITLVVFPFSSTSNHNLYGVILNHHWLYFLSLLHQTTTSSFSSLNLLLLYFLSLLHQTTTCAF